MRVLTAIGLTVVGAVIGTALIGAAPASAAEIEFCDPIWHAASAGDRASVLERLQRAGALDAGDRFICSTIGSDMTRHAQSPTQGPTEVPGAGVPALAALGGAFCKAKHLYQQALCARRPASERDACVKAEQARYDRTQARCE